MSPVTGPKYQICANLIKINRNKTPNTLAQNFIEGQNATCYKYVAGTTTILKAMRRVFLQPLLYERRNFNFH